MLKGIIFDLDGTLIDSLGDLADSVNAVLARAGLPCHDREAFRLMIGDGLARLVSSALPASFRGSPREAEIRAAVAAEYEARCLATTLPYPGIEAALDFARSIGLPLAVLTNKPEAFACRLVDALFPSRPFAAVRGQIEGRPRKPDPAAALGIAGDICIPPAQLAIVGDSAVDIETARNAGMVPVGVSWGFRDRKELLEAGASAILDSPAALRDYLLAEAGSVASPTSLR